MFLDPPFGYPFDNILLLPERPTFPGTGDGENGESAIQGMKDDQPLFWETDTMWTARGSIPKVGSPAIAAMSYKQYRLG